MLKILKLLNECKIIKNYEILDFKWGENFYYLKIKCFLKNKTLLYIREYVNEKERMYSYHRQDKNGKLICRWDNAPYHFKIKTFPHHKHTDKRITESTQTSIEEILEYIKGKIYRK